MAKRERLDRHDASGVFMGVTRLACIFAVLLLVACGGKAKKGPTGPGGGPAGAGDPASADPEGGIPEGGTVPGDVDDGSAGYAGSDPNPPDIKPPGVDLTPEEQKKIVTTRLASARKALDRKTPDPDQAITDARAALQADETSVEAMIVLAHANFVKGYLDLAEDILNKATERGGKKHKEAHFLMGVIYERTDRAEKAPARYKAALAIDPNYRSALWNLGVHQLKNKQFADAVRTFERLTGELKVNNPTVWSNVASAYRGRSAEVAPTNMEQRNKLLVEAEKNYRRAISLDKNYADAYFNLGVLYLDADAFPTSKGEMDRLDRLKKAKTYFDEYRRLPGADLKAVDAVAATAQKLIDKEELLRKKQAERAAKQKAREEAKKKADEKADEKTDSSDDDEFGEFQ